MIYSGLQLDEVHLRNRVYSRNPVSLGKLGLKAAFLTTPVCPVSVLSKMPWEFDRG
ncbi:hypothetical protein [Argonema antarcticum]|uniref:hypothetical protein n=1 Tax=Argonema antarcticum TaxID=2942763 RepID=UPI002011B69C|nr:hypothetical protein [Argonema antarcticum]MCL1470896.1 hypothetical protein [Argonema antarcticum A004/B2]